MKYFEQNGCTYQKDDDGNDILLANFTARITHETRYEDGMSTTTSLVIEGERQNPDKNAKEHIPLRPVAVDANDFASMSWVAANWGVQCVIRPGSGVKDHLRTAIQLESNPEQKTVYKHIGWTKIGGKPAYLHGDGAISAKGNDPSVEVKLSDELSRYSLTSPTPAIEAIRATLGLTKLTKPEVTWPLLASCMAPLFGQVNFATHLTGRTGTFKSEFISLWQSHYGAKMDATHLPGSWSSTANALEAQAFYAANAVFVIDDFVPTGSAWQIRAYQATAEKVLRAQGNQAGRQRMTDTSRLQTAMFPRGLIMSTGEDTPEGHSIRARLMIMELSPGDIQPNDLKKAQENREKYPATIAALVQHLAENGQPSLQAQANSIRDKNRGVGHTRTPAMLGTLIATANYFLDWAEFVKAITPKDSARLLKEATAAIMTAGQNQQQYLEATDPTDLFIVAVRNTIAAGQGHFRSLNGGIPKNAQLLGYNVEEGMDDMPLYKKRGQPIGWVDWSKNEMYIDAVGGLSIILKNAGKEITLTKQTLMKRLKDAGKLSRTDDARQRNTIRIMAEGHARQVIALKLASTLDTQELPNE